MFVKEKKSNKIKNGSCVALLQSKPDIHGFLRIIFFLKISW